jgi:hypothetical protein
MKKIAHIMLIAALLISFAPVHMNAQQKVVESSQKRAPKWINGLVKDYIIIVGTGSDIEKAKEDALIRIKEKIIRAVAENVTFESKMTRKEDMLNNLSSYAENYESTTQSKSADVSFVKGISLTKAEEFYWEELRDKKAGTGIFHYHVKYPFSEGELKKLVMAFEKIDRELTKQLNGILDNIESMTSIEAMEGAIKELDQLKERFPGPRKDQAITGMTQLKTRLQSITVNPEINKKGHIEYSLVIGDQVVIASKKPKVMVPNKCATVTNIEPTKTGWKILYDPQYCFDDPDNRVNIRHSIKYNTLKHDFYFNINEDQVKIHLNGDILMNAGDMDSETARNVKITFNIHSKYDSPFIIDRVVLKYDKISPISFNNVNKTFEGKGDHELVLEVDKDLKISEYSSNATPLVNGMIYYKSKATGESFTEKLYKHTITTNF